MANGDNEQELPQEEEQKNITDPENQEDVSQTEPTQDPEDFQFADIGVNLLDESRKESRTPEPVRHPNVDVQNFLDYTGEDLNLLTDDAEKLRARRQSHWSQIGGFLNQAIVGELIGGTVEAAGWLTDMAAAKDIAQGQENDFSNALSEAGKSIREWTKETTPIYEEEPGSTSPLDPAWWAKNGASIATTFSLMLPAVGGTALVGKALRGASKGARLVNKSLDIAKKFDQASDITKGTIRGLGQAGLSRHAENMMESSQVYKELRDKYLDRGLSEEQASKQAAKGARATYATGSDLIWQDIGQYMLFNGLAGKVAGRTAGSSGQARSISDAIENKLPGGKITAVASDMVTEGAEEAYQYIAQEEGKYLADTQMGIREESDYSDRLKSYMADGELLNSAIFGGLGAGVMQTAGSQVIGRLRKKAGGFNNHPLDFQRKNHSMLSHTAQAVKAAEDNDLTEEGENIKEGSMVDNAIKHLDVEDFPARMSELRAMEQMSDEEAQEAAQVMKERFDVEWSPQQIRDNAKRQREVAEQAQKHYNQFRDKHGKEWAASLTKEQMDNDIHRERGKQKQQEYENFKTEIPEFEELSSQGQNLLDLRMKREGLKRAERSAQKVLENFDSDPQIAGKWQSVLDNVQNKRENIENKIKKEEKKEYDAEQMENDRQLLENTDMYMEDAAKILSQRELAGQYANVSRNTLNSKIKKAQQRSENQKRQRKSKKREEFNEKYVPADNVNEPFKKGDVLEFNGKRRVYNGSFIKSNGEKVHSLKDFDQPNQSSNIPDSEFTQEKIERYKSSEDLADEQDQRQRDQQVGEEQKARRKAKNKQAGPTQTDDITDEAKKYIEKVEGGAATSITNNVKKIADQNDVEIESSDTPSDVADKLKAKQREFERRRQQADQTEPEAGQQPPMNLEDVPTTGEQGQAEPTADQEAPQTLGDVPTVGDQQTTEDTGEPSPAERDRLPISDTIDISEEKLDDIDRVVNTLGATSGFVGGAEDVITPDNGPPVEDADPGKPSSANKLSRISRPMALTVSSTRNPKSHVRRALENGEITEDSERWKDAQALTEFTENRKPVTDADGNPKYYVETDINEEFLQDRYPDIYEKYKNREDLNPDELDKVPIQTYFYYTEDGSAVEVNGRHVWSNLHTVNYIDNNWYSEGSSQTAEATKEKLRRTRRQIYNSHIRGTSQQAYVTKKKRGHFINGAEEGQLTLGDFDSYNNVAEVLGTNAEDVSLSILNDSGQYTGATGQVHPDMLTVGEGNPNQAGAVYAAVTDANGETRPMRLFADNINEQEADVLFDIYRNLVEGEATPSDTLTNDIKNRIRESENSRISQIEDILGSLDDVTHQQLRDFLVFEGRQVTNYKGSSQLWANLSGDNSELVYGDDLKQVFRGEFNENARQEFKNWITNNRRRQVTRGFINTPEYNRYLIDNGILRTVTAVTEEGNPLHGPMTEVGEFSEPTQQGDIDHVTPWDEEVEQQQAEEFENEHEEEIAHQRSRIREAKRDLQENIENIPTEEEIQEIHKELDSLIKKEYKDRLTGEVVAANGYRYVSEDFVTDVDRAKKLVNRVREYKNTTLENVEYDTKEEYYEAVAQITIDAAEKEIEWQRKMLREEQEETEEQTEEDTDTGTDQTMNDLFQRVNMSRETPLTDNMTERGMRRMLDRLQERFNIPYNIINDESVQWAGKVENGTVFINTAHAKVDTPFHEYAHPFVQQIKRQNTRLFSNLVQEMRVSPQGQQILKRVRNQYPDLTEAQQVEESLVQALGEFASNNVREDVSAFRRFLEDLWHMIKRTMQRLLWQDTTVEISEIGPEKSLSQISDMLSDDITNIDLSGTPITADQRPNWMTQEQYRDWVDSMTFALINSNTSKDFSEIGDIKLTHLRDLLQSTYRQYLETDGNEHITEQYRKVLQEITEEGSDRLDPQSDLLLSIQRKLRTYGIKPDEEVRPEERDSRLNIRASYEFSAKDKATSNVKLMVASIPKLNSANKVINKFSKNDEDTKPDYDISPHTGLPKFHNFADTWNVLQNELADTVEYVDENGDLRDLYDIFMEKIEEASTYRPEITILKERLENTPQNKKTQFVQALSLASQNFLSITFQKSGDGYKFKIGRADTQSIEDKILDEWNANFKNKLLKVDQDEQGNTNYVIDQDKANALVQRYKDLKTLINRKNRNDPLDDVKDNLISLLNDTGIDITSRTLRYLMDQVDAQGDRRKLSQLIKGTRATSIQYVYTGTEHSLEKKAGKALNIDNDQVVTPLRDEKFVRRKMTAAESYFSNNLADNTILGPENKPFWEFSLFNSMNKKIAEWKQTKQPLERLKQNSAYASNSKWIEHLLKSQENRDNFQLRNLASIRQEFSSDVGRKNTQLDIADMLAIRINAMLNETWALPARADNTTEYYIEGVSFEDILPKNGQAYRKSGGSIQLNNEATKVLKGYVLDEIGRIRNAEKQIEQLPQDEWVKDFHYKEEVQDGEIVKNTDKGNAFKIYSFDAFNPPTQREQEIIDKRENGEELTAEEQRIYDNINDKSRLIFKDNGKVIDPSSEFFDDQAIEDVIRDEFMSQLARDMRTARNKGVISRNNKREWRSNAIDKDIVSNYKNDVGSENLGVQAAMLDYTFGGIMANQEWFKLFGGDIAAYKNVDDFQKRATGPGSTGLIYRLQDDMDRYYRSAVVREIETNSELTSDESIKQIAEYSDMSQEEVRDILEGYNNVERADAQAWITVDEFRDRMRGYGKWTQDHETAYQRLKRGEQLPSDLKLFLEPLKTVHTEMKIDDGNSIFHYNKQSEAVLHPQIAETLGLGNLLDAMENQDIDHVVVESGRKVGAKGITSIADDEGNILPSSEITLNGEDLDKRHLFLSQQLPHKGMAPAKEGSQVRKNMLEGIVDDGNYTMPDGTEINGEELRNEIHNAVGGLSDKGLQEFMDMINYDEESGTFDHSRLSNILIDQFTEREVNDNLIHALRNNYPFDALPQMRFAIENQLANMIDKRAVELRHDTGGAFIQMSDIGWSQQEDTGIQSDQILYLNEEARDGLKPPRIENGEFKPGQIFIPHKVVDQLPDDVSADQLRDFLRKANTGISYRIPNQMHSSNDVIEIAGVLPKEMGDTAIVYNGATEKYGSDFDIDKLNVMLPNYEIRDGELHVNQMHFIDTNNEEALGDLYEDRFYNLLETKQILSDAQYQSVAEIIEHERNKDLEHMSGIFTGFMQEESSRGYVKNVLMEGLDIAPNEAQSMVDNLYELEIDSLMNIPTKAQWVQQNKGKSVYEVNSKKALQNYKLDLYETMLSNKNTYIHMMKPLESDELKQMIREKSPERELSGTEVFSPTVQAAIRKRFVDANSAVGQWANHVTDHAFSQSANLYLNNKVQSGEAEPFYLGIGNQVEINGEPATYLSAVNNQNDKRISEILSAFLTANVDAAKDPYIADGNFNLFTNSTAALLVRAGVPQQFVVDFFNTSVLREYKERYNKQTGRTTERERVPKVEEESIEGGEVGALDRMVFELTRSSDKLHGSDKIDSVSYKEDVSEEDRVEMNPAEIDPNDVIKKIRRGDSSPETKLQTLKLFEFWRGFAGDLSDSIQASKADVNGSGGSLTSAMTNEANRRKVEMEGTIGNFENKFNGTFLENFYNNSIIASQQIFGDSFMHMSQAFSDATDSIAASIGRYPLTDPDLAFNIHSELYAYVMANTDFSMSQTEVENMFRGRGKNKSMARRILNAKGHEDSPIQDNPFIQHLGVKLADQESGLDFVYGQGTKKLSQEAQNELTEGWRDLLTHDRRRVRRLAEDLGRYAFYSSGFKRNLASFYELMPVELNERLSGHEEGIRGVIEELKSQMTSNINPLAPAENQVLKNMSDNGRVVPNLSGKHPQIRKLRKKTNVPTREAFAINPSNAPEYLRAGKDTSGNPVGKPFINAGGQLYEYRGLGTRPQDEADTMKERQVFVYTPTQNLGVKSGRFRIKEYYYDTPNPSSAFNDLNDGKVSERAEKEVENLNPVKNPPEMTDNSNPGKVEQQTRQKTINTLIDEAEGLSQEQKETYINDYKENQQDNMSPREYIEALKDHLNC